ncbi:amidohydrolase family protein [Antarcticimicrobium sediminis]|uniref:N-ethylammeline chlorohydrolase n=1 Tax=Antarcticimicrobium sediminis TaxID=2546227 RepID=A0A4R5EJE4_9RHOB|nr:amidohydrolase family protein [Antarcticimicrobium sediminis]TDE34512.1 N-ethylammeline chlorohydrolase [Antarcticimicrobium sediminis]
MTSPTVIRNAAYIIAWDADADGHTLLQNQDLAFDDTGILQVGGTWEGPVAEEIDGSKRLVSPGLVNIHSHPSSEAMNKGMLDELGSPGLRMSSLYEFMPLFRPDAQGTPFATRVAYSELALSGVTTVVDLSVPYENWLDLAEQSGLRVVIAPMYRSARWFTKTGHSVEYEWAEDDGRGVMDEALKVVDEAIAHPCDRLSGMVAPAQIDTCSAELIRNSFAEAQSRGVKMQIHAAQSMVEFNEITSRHGRTPIEWLDDLGVLTDGVIIGHGIFLNDHPWTAWPGAEDFDTLKSSGAAVAHCPTVFQRRGVTMNTFGRYLRNGIPMGIGTDTYPHNMLEEIRHALINSRIISQNPYDLRTTSAFDAATTGGASVLGMDDIGKLAPGMKADLFLADISHRAMRPLRDPLASLIYVAGERAVTDTFVDGKALVRDGVLTTFDLDEALDGLEAAQARAAEAFQTLDFRNRTHDEAAPINYLRGDS